MKNLLDRKTVDGKLDDSIQYLFGEACLDFNFLHMLTDECHEQIEAEITAWSDSNYNYRIHYANGDFKLLRKIVIL